MALVAKEHVNIFKAMPLSKGVLGIVEGGDVLLIMYNARKKV